MDTRKNMEIAEKYQERIRELFKELAIATDTIDASWADTFEIESVNGKKVVISYHGTEDIKVFKKECVDSLVFCVDSILGKGKKIKITKKRRRKSVDSKTKKNIKAAKFFVIGIFFVCVAFAVILVLSAYIENRKFRETFYSTSSIKINSPIRVIQVSDLHGVSYGENNKVLLERIEDLDPDVIICTGDIVNSTVDEVEYAVALGQALSKIAPSYYIYGNNEVESIYDFPLNEKELDEKFGFDESNRDETALLNVEDSFEQKLENVGMKVLKNEKDTIQIGTMTIDIYGVLTSNPSSFWSYSEKAFLDYIYENPNNFKITAVHEPFIFETFSPDFWGDLMLCGHTHGGVMRIPVLGPLFTKEGGLFPERGGNFVYGRYDTAGKPLIVSGGLENTNVFRVNNQPELVVIDVNKF